MNKSPWQSLDTGFKTSKNFHYFTGFFVKPLLMHLAQTYAVWVLPSRTTFCFWRLGLKVLLVFLFEWL